MVTNVQIAGVGVACLLIAVGIGIFYFDLGITEGSIDDYFAGFGTVSSFSLTQDFSNARCEMFNEIWIESNGSEILVASFSERETIFIDSQFQNQLSLTAGGKDVDSIHTKLFLECKGNALDGSTVVSGTVKIRERMSSSPEVFFVGVDRPVSMFGTFTINPVAIQDGVKKAVFDYEITSSQIDSALSMQGDGSKHFKSEMLPKLTLGFNHPTVGVFSGSYDLEANGSPIIAQYSFSFVNELASPIEDTELTGETITIDNSAPIIVDTDGDGINDSTDTCPTLPETVNGYQDTDGCPDVEPEISDPLPVNNETTEDTGFDTIVIEEPGDESVQDGDSIFDIVSDDSIIQAVDDLGSTTIIPFSNAGSDDDPTGIIIIVIVFVGFIGAVFALNHLKKK